jgi:hypothetical protein
MEKEQTYGSKTGCLEKVIRGQLPLWFRIPLAVSELIEASTASREDLVRTVFTPFDAVLLSEKGREVWNIED